MTKVIGYKGSIKERLLNWKTMLMLRECIEYDKDYNKDNLERERQIYSSFLRDYTK